MDNRDYIHWAGDPVKLSPTPVSTWRGRLVHLEVPCQLGWRSSVPEYGPRHGPVYIDPEDLPGYREFTQDSAKYNGSDSNLRATEDASKVDCPDCREIWWEYVERRIEEDTK